MKLSTEPITSVDSEMSDIDKPKKYTRKKSTSKITEEPMVSTVDSFAEPTESSISKGVKISTSLRIPIYVSSVSVDPVRYVKGCFSIYDGVIVTGRVRICNLLSDKTGDSSCVGWVNVGDITKYIVK